MQHSGTGKGFVKLSLLNINNLKKEIKMTEKWIYLTSDNVREVLAKDEIEKLQTISLDEDLDDII